MIKRDVKNKQNKQTMQANYRLLEVPAQICDLNTNVILNWIL